MLYIKRYLIRTLDGQICHDYCSLLYMYVMGFLVFGVENVEAQPIFLRNSLLPFDHFCLRPKMYTSEISALNHLKSDPTPTYIIVVDWIWVHVAQKVAIWRR